MALTMFATSCPNLTNAAPAASAATPTAANDVPSPFAETDAALAFFPTPLRALDALSLRLRIIFTVFVAITNPQY